MPLRFVAIDFETANPRRDSACALGLVRVEGKKIVARHFTLIRPPTKEFWFTKLHGISWDHVKSAPSFRAAWIEARTYLYGVDFLVAHNVGFDRSVLRACCEASRLSEPEVPFACSMHLAKTALRFKTAKLDHICKSLKIPLTHHDALSDAEACARIVLHAKTKGAWLPG